jgi:hypothetical protein
MFLHLWQFPLILLIICQKLFFNKKSKIKIDSAASSGEPGKITHLM